MVELPSADAVLYCMQIVRNELMVFTLFWFILGTVDELAIDLVWIWLRLTGRNTTPRLSSSAAAAPLDRPVAVFFPTWQEADVIGATIAHTLGAWPQTLLRIYVGCYANDPGTRRAAAAAGAGDDRLRIVLLDRQGPTTKADCLNGLYAALAADEARHGMRFHGVILQDAEDMVHPAGLGLIAGALNEVDFVQLPVRPEPQPYSRWVAGHYGDEFVEAHAKALVVRDALGAALPAAGVGCGFGRDILEALAGPRRGEGVAGPFAAECLTEDYELGWLIARWGQRSRFIRVRDAEGELVATRAYFPATITTAVRQKTRWIHGIALQSWDRLGWTRRPVDIWMALRDRRGPLTALVLVAAYALLVLEALLLGARAVGWDGGTEPSPLIRVLLVACLTGFAWRAVMRFGFTAREYGLVEGVRGVFRIPIGNIIAILASRRAVFAYFRSLRGMRVEWDKTTHNAHPTQAMRATPKP